MTMWMVRAESDGSLFQPFIDKSLVAIGWADVRDLRPLRVQGRACR